MHRRSSATKFAISFPKLDNFHGKTTGYFKHGCRCESCVAAGRAWGRENYAKDPDKFIARQMMRNFGITPERYEELLAAQGGGCAICHSPDPGKGKRFAIDHDHNCCPGRVTCGKCIRGLLCQKCNRGLGLFNDDPDRMEAAVRYLISQIG